MDALAESSLFIPDGYNSDEFLDDPVPEPPTKHLGFKNAAAIFKNATENRTGSKKALKNHQSTAAAPTTQHARTRWGNYFDAFMRTLNLGPDTAPNGDQMYRFVWTMIRTLKPHDIGKPVASLDTLKGGLKSLGVLLVERNETFKITSQTSAKLDSLFNNSVHEGLLTKGRWRARNRVGFRTLSRLTRAWMLTALTQGILSWDVHLSKHLNIVLVAAFSARAGDIVRSVLYTGMECLIFSDLTLKFVGGNGMKDLVLLASLRFVKCYKDLPHENRELRIDVLRSSEDNSNCAIKLLLIHALRNGMVRGQTWEEVRHSALEREDKTIQWVKPSLPVIPAIKASGTFLDWDKPATTGQTFTTMAQMSLKSCCSIRFRPKDLRNGAVSDLAHMKKAVLGVATMEVAAAVGHSMGTFMSDTTGRYAGPSDVDMWNLRAESQWEDSRAAAFMQIPFVPEPIPKAKKIEYCIQKGWDLEDPLVARNVVEHLRREQINKWREAGKNSLVADIRPAPTRAIQPLREKSKNNRVQPARSQPLTKTDDKLLSNIDPRLWSGTEGDVENADVEDESTDEVPLDESQLENAEFVRDIIMGTLGDEDQDTLQDQFEDQMELLDNIEQAAPIHQVIDESNPINSFHENFVSYFASINIISNQTVGRFGETKFQEVAPKFVAIGNSRNEPTRYIFHCINRNFGCQYSNTNKHKAEGHSRICRISEDAPPLKAKFKCRKQNCEAVFVAVSSRNQHERDHDWVPKKCDLGCQSDKIYTSGKAWQTHKYDYHDPAWDRTMMCMIEGCTRVEPFTSRPGAQSHLQRVHHLQTNEIRSLLPKKTYGYPIWESQPCPIPNCTRAKAGNFIDLQRDMVRHLSTRHPGHKLPAAQVEEHMQKILATLK